MVSRRAMLILSTLLVVMFTVSSAAPIDVDEKTHTVAPEPAFDHEETTPMHDGEHEMDVSTADYRHLLYHNDAATPTQATFKEDALLFRDQDAHVVTPESDTAQQFQPFFDEKNS